MTAILGHLVPRSHIAGLLGILQVSSLLLSVSPAHGAEPRRLTALSEGPWRLTAFGDRLFVVAIGPGLGPQLWVLDIGELVHPFRRADCNSNGVVEVSDAIVTLESLFLSGERPICDDACDSKDDGEVDISDAIVTLDLLFRGGVEIPFPGTLRCGFDQTANLLTCHFTESCP